MSDSLQQRLRRLGVVKGARHIEPATPRKPAESRRPAPPPGRYATTPRPAAAQPLEELFPGGRLEETDAGACFVVDKVYGCSHEHGGEPLERLLQLRPAPAALFCADERLAELDFRDFLFLDTETTGLAGAGTIAFMVGAGFFERGPAGDAFVVRQYFLRDHADEAAMLLLLDDLLAEKAALVTFNGRSFDLPLLDNRYLMNRMPGAVLDAPHIDLLPPARRLWRARLGSVALSALEQNLLGVRRSHEDVPGWLIPGLYNDYLRSGDVGELRRVFYHNHVDMLSMVTLARRVLRQFADPRDGDDPLDLYSLGSWQIHLGLADEGELNLRRAAGADLPLAHYHDALRRLGLLLKRAERREEALAVWQQWAATSFDTVEAHEELAKHYEWHGGDLQAAHDWTRRALDLVATWPRRAERQLVQPALEHRLARLERKLSG